MREVLQGDNENATGETGRHASIATGD